MDEVKTDNSAAISRLTRERDEARAECERLRGELQEWKDKARQADSAWRHYLHLSADFNKENKRLREDSRRLEWLVNPAHSITRDGNKYRTFIHRHIFMSDWYEDFRDAIDAAREKE